MCGWRGEGGMKGEIEPSQTRHPPPPTETPHTHTHTHRWSYIHIQPNAIPLQTLESNHLPTVQSDASVIRLAHSSHENLLPLLLRVFLAILQRPWRISCNLLSDCQVAVTPCGLRCGTGFVRWCCFPLLFICTL